MKPELRDKVTVVAVSMAEFTGYERGVRAALAAVKGMRSPRNMTSERSGEWWDRAKADERAIERLLEEAGKGRVGG